MGCVSALSYNKYIVVNRIGYGLGIIKNDAEC